MARYKQIVIDADLHNIVRMTKGVSFKLIKNWYEKSDMQQQQSQQGKNDDSN